MSMREEEIAARAEQNLQEYMEHGPGLRYTTRTWIVARDRARKKVLLGGLGCMGCGQMWFDDKERYAADPTYADAPELPCEN